MAFSRDRCNSSECRIPIDPATQGTCWGWADIPYNYCSEQCLNDAKNKYIPENYKIGYEFDFAASVQNWLDYSDEIGEILADIPDALPYCPTEREKKKQLEVAKTRAQEGADEWNRKQQAYIGEAHAKLYDRLNREYQAELREQAEKERGANAERRRHSSARLRYFLALFSGLDMTRPKCLRPRKEYSTIS